MSDIAENFDRIRKAVHKAERTAGRIEGETCLIAVSKTQSSDAIEQALASGQRVFGENKVQEAQEHWHGHRALFPDLQLHLIGPLQTNKVRDAVRLFDCIQTLDREKLALALAKEMASQGRDVACFVQINTGDEPQKAGIMPDQLGPFLRFCREECSLKISGLMCIPPQDEPAALHFALLKKLADRYNLAFRSMGMSADYTKAIALGATHIRVGTALFGERNSLIVPII